MINVRVSAAGGINVAWLTGALSGCHSAKPLERTQGPQPTNGTSKSEFSSLFAAATLRVNTFQWIGAGLPHDFDLLSKLLTELSPQEVVNDVYQAGARNTFRDMNSAPILTFFFYDLLLFFFQSLTSSRR